MNRNDKPRFTIPEHACYYDCVHTLSQMNKLLFHEHYGYLFLNYLNNSHIGVNEVFRKEKCAARGKLQYN